jgi:hypothetical protein
MADNQAEWTGFNDTNISTTTSHKKIKKIIQQK